MDDVRTREHLSLTLFIAIDGQPQFEQPGPVLHQPAFEVGSLAEEQNVFPWRAELVHRREILRWSGSHG
jgi:hypothetical protein